MKLEEQLTDALKITIKALNQADEINKRLTIANIVQTVAFSLCFVITVVGMTYLYFRSDYTYPQIQQTQIDSNNSSSNVDMKGGSK